MAAEEVIDRLRLEADTIMTRYEQVEAALEAARNEEGDHWERGEVDVELETPHGESLTVTLDLHADPATNAQRRYDEATERQRERERTKSISDRLAPMPADPVAYLICYHLDTVGGNYPRSIAGYLDADRSQIESLCEQLESGGLIERLESGTVKQRNAKAKQSNEVRQHHTYYRLSREGDHLLRWLQDREGQLNVLRQLPDGLAILNRLLRSGPESPRQTAEALDLAFEYTRHSFRGLRRVGILSATDTTESAAASESASEGSQTFTVTDRGEWAGEEIR